MAAPVSTLRPMHRLRSDNIHLRPTAPTAAPAHADAHIASDAHLHETLMGSMMARSTPRVLFHSTFVQYMVTALELIAALYAVVLFITIFALHLRFVRREGCSRLLLQWDLPSPARSSVAESSISHYAPNTAPIIEMAVSNDGAFAPAHRFRFSHERGFLLLSDESLAELNVSVAVVPLPREHPCLGDPVSRFILFHFVGYETVVVNAFARMRRRIRRRNGYVLSVHSRRLLNLLHADPDINTDQMHKTKRFVVRFIWKCGAVMTAVFIMCTTGALVAFTLKEVQLRMIKLTMDLQYIMRSQLGYGRVIIRYAMDALVFVPIVAGMLFFLFEFFDDQALAFAVLIITWLCEFAASGSTRHWISRLYLPRLFFCYFGAFHVYFFSFPLGFSWLAFATSLVFMVHAALSVWNHCELPLLRRERYVQSEWR